MRHHNVSHADVKGWLFLAALGRKDGKIMEYGGDGRPVAGRLIEKIERVLVERKIDLVALDPFVKTHTLEENSNTAMDQVAQALTDLTIKHNIAIDLSHHTRKGTADPGNADSGRGASATKDAGRLVKTLTRMTPEEARLFGISEEQRPFYLRMDNAKVNITPPATAAKWLRLVSVPLGNCTDLYPNGDEVQTVERWTPPSVWKDISVDVINRTLAVIDAGFPNGSRYSDTPSAKDRAAWKVVVQNAPEKNEAQARQVIRTWVKNGLLVPEKYHDQAERKNLIGLRVGNSKRPT
jgi:hypothetical protein